MEEMDASLKQYVIGYIAIVTPIALSILFMRRGSNSPVQLRLKNESANKKRDVTMTAPEPNRNRVNSPTVKETPTEKSLNAFFNWNGHLWDAYEAFGLPAGSSLESVHSAYERSIVDADDNTKLFFKAALDAISHSRK